MMMTGPLIAWIQKLTVQHSTFEVENLFNKPQNIHTCLPMIASIGKQFICTVLQRSCGKIVFSVVCACHSVHKRMGFHVNTAHDAIGQSQVT